MVETWANLLQTFGLAVMIIVASGYALWKGVRWAGREIIIPIRDRIISRVITAADKLESTLDKLDRNVEAGMKAFDSTSRKVESTLTKVDQNVALMLRLQGKQTGETKKQTVIAKEAAGAMREVADSARQIVQNGADNGH